MRLIKNARLEKESGLTLIELMIAMTVLAVGLAGIMAIVVAALYGNNRNHTDTSATMLSQMVIEQIADVPANDNTILNVTDCAGVKWNISTTAGAIGVPVGATLKGTNNSPVWVANDIDFNVAQPGAGYFMNYTTCSTNGSPGIVYDVRWTLTQTTAFTKSVVVATRIKATVTNTSGGNIYFAIPVQLKTVLGT
jgi:Tfp pilus assembly protein PilV